jgi:hypothetical protein
VHKLTRVHSFLQGNHLTGYEPSFVNFVKNSSIISFGIIPNGIKNVSFDILLKSPFSTMTNKLFSQLVYKANVTLTNKIVKRQIVSYASFSSIQNTQPFLDLCPLGSGISEEVLSGCFIGIIFFCQKQRNDLSMCHSFYDTVLKSSSYAPIGAVCPSWKQGPRSPACKTAVSSYQANLVYTVLNKSFAEFLVQTILANPVYAPCNDAYTTCKW